MNDLNERMIYKISSKRRTSQKREGKKSNYVQERMQVCVKNREKREETEPE